METFLVTGNFFGGIQDFYLFFFFLLLGREEAGGRGGRGTGGTGGGGREVKNMSEKEKE